jgi:two-component sensor histidine kinase
MIQSLLVHGETTGVSLLHVAELIHRIRNEYACAISFASLMAAKTHSQETKAALGEMIRHLHSVAQAHNVLWPPFSEGMADLSETLMQLCQTVAGSSEIEHRGITLLYSFERSVMVEAGRCWRAGLIVSELINNARRHAFGARSGNISVAIAIRAEK